MGPRKHDTLRSSNTPDGPVTEPDTAFRLDGRREKAFSEPRHWDSPSDVIDWSHKHGHLEVKRVHQVDLSGLVGTLDEISKKQSTRHIAQSPSQAIIRRPSVTREALKALGNLTFETKIADFGGELHFMTGSKLTTMPEYPGAPFLTSDSPLARALRGIALASMTPGLRDAIFMNANIDTASRFVLHNHPSDAASRHINSPSINDVNVAGSSYADVHFIATKDGIIVFQYSKQGADPKRQSLVGSLRRRFQNPSTIVKDEVESGITRAFIPWDGDERDLSRIDLVCKYIQDRDIKWEDVEKDVVG